MAAALCPEEITSGGTRYTHEARGAIDVYLAEGKRGALDEAEHTWRYCVDKERDKVYFFCAASNKTVWILPDIYPAPTADALEAATLAVRGGGGSASDLPAMRVRGVTERSASRRTNSASSSSPTAINTSATYENAGAGVAAAANTSMNVSGGGSTPASARATPVQPKSFEETRRAIEEDLRRKMMDRLGKGTAATAPPATPATPIVATPATAAAPAAPVSVAPEILVRQPTETVEAAIAPGKTVATAVASTPSSPPSLLTVPETAGGDGASQSANRGRATSIKERLAMHRQRSTSQGQGRLTPDRSSNTTPIIDATPQQFSSSNNTTMATAVGSAGGGGEATPTNASLGRPPPAMSPATASPVEAPAPEADAPFDLQDRKSVV